MLKRAENHDARFRDLIQTLFEQVLQTIGGLHGQKVVRLESGILISSAATITPFHYDPEIGCFSQIEGEKMYHVYPPAVISDKQLERSCLSTPVNLSPLELGSVDPTREYVFRLTAGKGFHQPQNSPHWVETGNSRSISYTFVFETDATRAVARTRAFNHYLRKLRLHPTPPGTRPAADAAKSYTMRMVIPVRRQVGSVVNKLRFG